MIFSADHQNFARTNVERTDLEHFMQFDFSILFPHPFYLSLKNSELGVNAQIFFRKSSKNRKIEINMSK